MQLGYKLETLIILVHPEREHPLEMIQFEEMCALRIRRTTK